MSMTLAAYPFFVELKLSTKLPEVMHLLFINISRSNVVLNP